MLPCQDGPASTGGSRFNVPSCNPSSPPNSTHKQGVHLQLWETEDSHAPVVPVVPSLPWLRVPGSCGSALTCSSRGHFPPLFSHLSRPPAHSSPPTSQGNGGCQWNSLLRPHSNTLTCIPLPPGLVVLLSHPIPSNSSNVTCGPPSAMAPP